MLKGIYTPLSGATAQEKVLEIIIREYVKNVTPVGSKLICDELKCSSATVRN